LSSPSTQKKRVDKTIGLTRDSNRKSIVKPHPRKGVFSKGAGGKTLEDSGLEMKALSRGANIY